MRGDRAPKKRLDAVLTMEMLTARCIFAVCRTAEETTAGAVEGNIDAGPTSGLMIMCLLTIYKLVCRQGGMERYWETCT